MAMSITLAGFLCVYICLNTDFQLNLKYYTHAISGLNERKKMHQTLAGF